MPLNDNANIEVNFSHEIVFQSNVKLQISYVNEKEAVDLQNKANKLNWTIVVEND